MRLRPLTLNGNFILQIITFTNSVLVVFPNYFIGGSIQALCVLRTVQCVLCALCANKQESGFWIPVRNGGFWPYIVRKILQIQKLFSHCFTNNTVLAGELGPRGKLGPDNIRLNKIRFSCYCNNTCTSTAYRNPWYTILNMACHMDFGKLLMSYCNSKKNRISLSRVLSGPSLPRGPSSPVITVPWMIIDSGQCSLSAESYLVRRLHSDWIDRRCSSSLPSLKSLHCRCVEKVTLRTC